MNYVPQAVAKGNPMGALLAWLKVGARVTRGHHLLMRGDEVKDELFPETIREQQRDLGWREESLKPLFRRELDYDVTDDKPAIEPFKCP